MGWVVDVVSPMRRSRFERSLEQRSRVREVGVHETSVQGTIRIAGPGEVLVKLHFPVLFVSSPVVGFGGELSNDFPLKGSFPTMSMVVVRWAKKFSKSGKTYYVGADVGVTTTGQTDQVMFGHYRFDGKALTNPRGLIDWDDLDAEL